MKSLWIGILLLTVTSPAPGAAQQRPADAGAAAALLRPGSVIRVILPDGQKVIGRLGFAGDGRLGIRRADNGVDSLRLDRVRGLSVRGRQTRTGAIIGGIAGAGFGIFVGLLSNALCEGGTDCRGASPYLIAIPVFGGGGSLLGAVVGSAFPKWKRVFP